MKERLFALLLAAVMVLSLGMAAIPDGTVPDAGTQQSAQETGEDQKAPAGDATMPGDAPAPNDATVPGDATAPDDTTASDDAPAPGDATLPDDAPAPDDTRDSGADKAPANDETPPPPDGTEEDGEDGAAVISAQGETAPAAASDVTVTLKNNTKRTLTITMADGKPFKSGDKVPQDQSGGYILKVSPAARDISVTVEGDKEEPVYTKVQNGEIRFQDSDKDGAVTLTLDLLSGFQLYVKNSITGVTCAITDPLNGNTAVADGGWVYLPSVASHDVPLKAALTKGYTFDAGPDFVKYDPGSTSNNNLNVQDKDGDKKVTLTVVKALYLHITGNNAPVSVCPDPYSDSDTLKEGSELTAGEPFYVTVKGGFAVTAANATAEPAEDHYYLSFDIDPMTGEITRLYEVTPDGEGDVTIQVTQALDTTPARVKITYAGPDEAFVSKKEEMRQYAFPGTIFNVEIKPGYGLEVNGELTEVFEDEHGRRASVVVSVAGELTLTAVELRSDAKLAVKGDKYELVSTFGADLYLMDGSTIPNGSGYILVNNGTVIDEEKTTGGVCSYQDMVTVPGVAIYRRYYVQATSETVTVTLVPVEPIRWVETQLINGFEDQVTLGSSLLEEDPYGGDNYWVAVDPENETDADIWIHTADDAAAGSAKGFAIVLEGGEKVDTVYESADHKEYNIKVDDDADVLIVRVTLAVDLEVQAPGKPAEGRPGVSDEAGTEKQLKDKTMDVVVDAVKGGTPDGVTKEEAAAIAAAATAGKAITTQLVVANNVPAQADKTAIEKAAGDAKVALYVDAHIDVKADGATIGHITQTDEPIQLAVVLSQDVLAKGHIFFVVRSHGGKTDILPATLDGSTLTFSTDKFSTFGIASTDDISYATVDPIPDQTWTGKAITPKPVVKANGRTLTEGTDYTLEYKNNTDAGTATVTVKGKAPYTGTKEVSFKIVKPAADTGAGTGTGSGTGSKTAPATGDETPIALYAAILALSAAALALTVTRRKKTSR